MNLSYITAHWSAYLSARRAVSDRETLRGQNAMLLLTLIMIGFIGLIRL